MSYPVDYDQNEYNELMRRFKNLMELHDNQKKIIAKLQANNLQLADRIQELETMRRLSSERTPADIMEDEDDGMNID